MDVSNIYLFTLFCLLVLTGITVLLQFLSNKKEMRQKDTQINQLLKQMKQLRDQVEHVNHRETFRVDLADENCLFQVMNVEVLKNRTGTAKIKDISVNGLKISCNYDFPLKNEVIIKLEFKLQEEPFSFKAILLRKEAHIDNPDIIYGVQFVEMSSGERERLQICLNKLEIQRRDKLA